MDFNELLRYYDNKQMDEGLNKEDIKFLKKLERDINQIIGNFKLGEETKRIKRSGKL